MEISERLKDFRFIKLIKFKKNPTDDEVLLKHLDDGGNIGLLTGREYCLLVLDADMPIAEILIEKNLPLTLVHQTGRGKKHYLYFCKDAKNLKIDDSEGRRIADIQFNEKYIVAPPSRYLDSQTGIIGEYIILEDRDIATISFQIILDCFKDYLIFNIEQEDKEFKKLLNIEEKDPICKEIKSKITIKDILKERNIDITKNPTMCPLGHESIGAKCFSYTDEIFHCFHCEQSGSIFHLLMLLDKCDFITAKEKLMKLLKIENQEKQLSNENEYKNPLIFFSNDDTPKFIPKLLGDYILDKYHFKTIKGNDRQIYYYKDGYYQENGISLIKSLATYLLDSFFKEHYISEVISYIRNSTYIDAEEINNEWINLRNGLLNPITKEFKKHIPDIFCLQQIPINYDIEATCPLWIEQLKSKCDKEWKYDLTQEMFGYCFQHDNRFEKAFLLYGEPKTMKSTTLYILIQLLGEKNVTAMSLQYLTEDKHGPAFLFGCPANICPDLSARELRNTSVFLKVIGQDSITYGKKFEQEITFSPFTKLIFSCNVIPSTSNKNNAFYRRWCLIEYNIQTAEDKVDSEMRNKLLKELSGILNWSLEGLDRILKNNKLSYPLSIEETKDLYERNSDSISSFILNEINCENDDGEIKKRDVYKKYKEYCKNNILNCANQILFGKRFFEITGCGSKRIGNIPGYTGVSWKSIEIKRGLDNY